MDIPAIDMKGVWFFYGKAPILQDVTMTLEQGDFLAILGPNGGGKTTLLKLLLGLLKPHRGTIKLLGEPPREAKYRVGYLPQHTDFNTTFPITVMDVVLMGRLSRFRIGRPYSRDDQRAAEEALKKTGMWDYRRAPIGHLSGGQRQRVFIARALATDPEILLLDEPTASVDPDFEVGLFELLKKLNERVTIVVVTHDIGVISRHVRSVACVNKTLVFHAEGKITPEMMEMAYHCPVDLIAHGIPHRVLPLHPEE